MARHQFLSPEWIDAARELRDKHRDEARVPALEIRMNLLISSPPFEASELEAHLDSTGGGLVIDAGHLDAPDVTVRLDYPTAKAVLVDGNAEAAMQAFMTGRIRVDGDLAKLLAFQSSPPSPLQREVAEELREITA